MFSNLLQDKLSKLLKKRGGVPSLPHTKCPTEATVVARTP